MGGRQAGRADAPGYGQAAAARLEVRLGHPLLASRQGSPARSRWASTSTRRAGPMPTLARAGRARDDGHPSEHRRMAEGFMVLREGAHRELPAAHAPARQGDDGRGHPADRAAAGDQPGQQLQLQLDDHLRLRRRRGPAAAQGHDAEDHGVARQHAAKKTNPIRTSGWAGAIAPWTKWPTPGSTSST